MKKKLLAALILLTAIGSYDASAQSFLKKLENTAKNTLKKEVNKAVDKAKQAVAKGKQSNQSQQASQSAASAKSEKDVENSFYVLEVKAPITQGEVMIPYGPTVGELNGRKWVDLGLPSGTKWATANLGAASAKEVGDTYEWAEVTPTNDLKSQKNLVKGKWISGIGGNSTYDAASAKWGGEWRMPTKGSFKELFEHCTWEVTSLGNIKGCKVTSKINGNYIFFPFNSKEDITHYWCSTPNRSDKNDTADALSINGGEYGLGTPDRAEHSFIRPVIKP